MRLDQWKREKRKVDKEQEAEEEEVLVVEFKDSF
jgi:hypothetical protein